MPKVGFKMTDESKQKMRLAKLGKKLSDEHKRKLSEGQKNSSKINTGRFKKGLIPWTKGKKGIHFSPSTEFKKGFHPSISTEFKKGRKPWNIGLKYAVWFKVPQYSNVHSWLKYNFGSANKCENKECSNMYKIFHWALLRGKVYEKVRENFIQLCMSCHQKYDRNPNYQIVL